MDIARLKELTDFLAKLKIGLDKDEVAERVRRKFKLELKRSVYFCEDFAIRFSSSTSGFSNTVLSLSVLKGYDRIPFIAVLVKPSGIDCYLANTTLLNKISHSSQKLNMTNVRGSFNGSDILGELNGIPNTANNFESLFRLHEPIGFEGNLERLVENTNNIVGSGSRFQPSKEEIALILDSPSRAQRFVLSSEYTKVSDSLETRRKRFNKELQLAASINNVNLRGKVIEYLLVGKDQQILGDISVYLTSGVGVLPDFKTDHELGDYRVNFGSYDIAVDVKSKVLTLDSNPKAYNLDKMLQFLANPNSVFVFYFVGIGNSKISTVSLTSIFEEKLLSATILLKHWSGRNSRGVSQFEGRIISELLKNPDNRIDLAAATAFLESILALP